jgi:uncharacterized membrane protein
MMRLAAPAIVCAWMMGPAVSPAAADFTLCNQTSYVLKAAVGYRERGRWHSRGWWTIHPGACEAALKGELDKSVYYTFAHSVSAHAGGMKYFDGSHRFCVDDADFEVQSRSDCDRKGMTDRRFSRIEIEGAKDWTTSFTETNDYDLEEARIAGAQRLLADIGLKAGRIDGMMGRRTRNAISRFKRTHNLERDQSLSPVFYDAMLEDAGKLKRDTGYELCNDTEQVIFAAIGYPGDKDVVSTGWYKLQPGECSKPLKDRLQHDTYYTYAEAEHTAGEQAIEWGGEHIFCTMDNRFTIRGKDDCEKRGFRQTGFHRVETGKKVGWTQTFSVNSIE